MKAVILFGLISVIFAQTIYPGAKARIQEKLINQGYNHYSGMITDAVEGQIADLQDVTITKGSLLFKVTLTFHTLTINKIDFTSANSVQVDIQPDNTVSITVTNIPFDMKLAFDLKYIFDTDTETIDVSANVASLNFVIKTAKDDQGCLSFDLTTLSGKIDNIDYQLDAHDVLVKAINFLGKWIFKGLIETAINQSWDKIRDAIQPELDQAEDLLKEYYSLQIPGTQFVVDLHVTSLASESDQVSLGLNGTIFDSLHPTISPPFSAQPIIDFQTDYPLSVQLSEYTTNSLLWTLYDLSYLKLDITAAMMPDTSPLKLDTESLNIYFPGIEDTFGNQNVSAHCEINDVPAVHYQDSNLTGEFKAYCDWKVNSTQGYVLAFTWQLTVDLCLNATLKTNSTGTFIQPYLGSVSFAALDYSNIHEGITIDPATSKQQFNILAMFAGRIVNSMDIWIEIPFPDYILIQDSRILFQEGSIEAGVLPKWYIAQLFKAWHA